MGRKSVLALYNSGGSESPGGEGLKGFTSIAERGGTPELGTRRWVEVMSRNKVSLVLRNSLSELDGVQRNLEKFGNALGLSKKSTFQINLAMEEVFSNIISYAYTDKREHWITVTMSHEKDALVLRIEDDGIPFNPCEVKVPDLECPLEERQIGGLGCYLMRCCVDDIAYERRGNSNVLTMKKTIGKS